MFKFKRTRKFLSRAVGVESIKDQHGFLKESAKNIFKIKNSTDCHRFDELAELGVDEQKIARALRHFTKLYRFFLIISLLLVCYFLYLLLYRTDYASSIVCFAVLCITLAQTFKNHFWCVQIRQKKLGLSLKAYFNSLIGKGGQK